MRSPRGAPRNVGPLSRKRLDAPTQSQDAGTTRQRVVAILRRKRTTQQEQKSATILPPMSSTRFASVPLYPIDPPKIHGTEITEDVDS